MKEGQTELLAAVGLVVAAFERLGVEYLVGGSIASSVFGEPRQTVDADLLARILGRHAKPLVEALSGEFYVDMEMILGAIQTQGCFNVIHLETVTKVDIFVRWRDPFGESQFARRQRKTVGESRPMELFFASPEDTVLAKLEWYRKGGCVSDQQWRDILGVLKIQAASIDRVYLAEWGGKLEVNDLLTRAIEESGIEKK